MHGLLLEVTEAVGGYDGLNSILSEAIDAALAKLPRQEWQLVEEAANELSDGLKAQSPGLRVGRRRALEILFAIGLFLEEVEGADGIPDRGRRPG